ncbi:MAG: hypothetical protein OXG25_02770 [Gammaproteobacteria bacterium]|nr:hypothetical protein [Gammaproteobacteria bacterium]
MEDGLVFVVLIVLIGCATGVITSYLKSKKKGVNRRVLERIERLEQQMGDESLEERVRALEAIVTDEKRRLDREIRNL